MAWVRIHDGAMSHPKIVGLIDWSNPFCLWVWGLSYAQQHLTNGTITHAALPNDRARKTAKKLVAAGCWEETAGGYQVHDYLDWNDSKETVQKKRSEAKERMANARQRSSREQIANFYVDRGVDRRISDRRSDSDQSIARGSPPADDAEMVLSQRAADFLDKYAELYTALRHGARLVRHGSNMDWTQARELCATWDDTRLEKLARIFLTTDEDWISRTDRGFRVFFMKASWCDERLAQWEAARARPA